MPTNIYFISVLLYASQSNLTIFGTIYMSSYSVLQMVALFALHFYLTKFSNYFHAPGYLLLKLASRMSLGSIRQNVRIHVKVANTVAAMHAVNRYGITYDRIGLVTLKTFVKVS